MIAMAIKWVGGAVVFSITTIVSVFVLVWVMENYFECLLMKKAFGILCDWLFKDEAGKGKQYA